MDENNQFDDFKEADSSQEYVSEAIGEVFKKEISEVEQFKEDLDDQLIMFDSPRDELTSMIVGYIQGMGDVDQVNICSYDNGKGVALDGWGFSGDDEMTSIDLFLTVYVDPNASKKISATELDRHFNWLVRFYEQSINGTMLGKIDDVKSDLYQVADLIHSTDKIDRVRLFLLTNAIAPTAYDKDNAELNDGKTQEQNYEVMGELEKLLVMELPLLVGISRKSMIYKLFGCTPNESLNGTTALNTIALMKGTSILRVHDVKEAAECVKVFSHLSPLTPNT